MIVILLLNIFLCPTIYAGAKIPPKGHGDLYLTAFINRSRENFDFYRNTALNAGEGEFNKFELGYFWRHSFKENWAFIARGSILNILTNKGNSFDQDYFGLGAQAFGLRYEYTEKDKHVRSLELLISLPTYNKNKVLIPGNGQVDIEIRHLIDWYDVYNVISFISFDQAYVKRFSAPADQIRLDLTIGKKFKNWIFMWQAFYIRSLENQEQNLVVSNPNFQSDFDLLNTGPGIVWVKDKKHSFQVSLWKDVWGRNVGKGRTFVLSYWRNY